ncbi:MAG TPA: peptide-methionine (S)-S-oxide reductase MsrA [Pirellulales bacterium]|nr:peptide-methionine (S)-S-oxide reductase MsrA [Pirellulales bacterium]
MFVIKRHRPVCGVLLVVVSAVIVLSGGSLPAAKPPAKKGTANSKSGKVADKKTGEEKDMNESSASNDAPAAGLQKATFGGGCFWCSEAVFQQIKGVRSVVSGYSGGVIKNPTYEAVCTGQTGHAEVIQITFDPQEVSYPELLEVFWQTHDPTTLNRQGADVGTQYRSVIFYHNQEQKDQAEHYKKELDKEHAFRSPIVTEITEFSEFFPAEDYHQNYYNLHKGQDYCAAVIRPKVSKVKKVFKDKLKEPATK